MAKIILIGTNLHRRVIKILPLDELNIKLSWAQVLTLGNQALVDCMASSAIWDYPPLEPKGSLPSGGGESIWPLSESKN